MTTSSWIDVSQPARLVRAADLAVVSRGLWAELARGASGAARHARLLGMLRRAAELGPTAAWRPLEAEAGTRSAVRWVDGVLVLRLEVEPAEEALGHVTETVGVELAEGHAVWPQPKAVMGMDGGGES